MAKRRHRTKTFDIFHGSKISSSATEAETWIIMCALFLTIAAGISSGSVLSFGLSDTSQCLVGEVTCSSLVGGTSSAANATALVDIDGDEDELLQVCIQVDWVCDGHDDCPDGEDENNCGDEGDTDGQMDSVTPDTSDSKPIDEPAEIRNPFKDWKPLPLLATSPPRPSTEAPTHLDILSTSSTAQRIPSTSSLRWADLRTLPPAPTPAVREFTSNDIMQSQTSAMESTILAPRPEPSFTSRSAKQDPNQMWLGPPLIDPFRSAPLSLIPATTSQEPILSYEEYKRRSMSTTTTTSRSISTLSASQVARTSSRTTTRFRSSTADYGGYYGSKTTSDSPYSLWTTTPSMPTTTSRYWWEAGRRNELGDNMPPWMKRLMKDNNNEGGIQNSTTQSSDEEPAPNRVLQLKTTATTTPAPYSATTAKSSTADVHGSTPAISVSGGRIWNISTSRMFTTTPSTTTTSRKRESSWSHRDWLNRRASTISASDVYYKGFGTRMTTSVRPPTTAAAPYTTSVPSSTPAEKLFNEKLPHPSDDDLRSTVAELMRKLDNLEKRLLDRNSPISMPAADGFEERIRQLEASTRAISPASCEELARLGESSSGWHYIDPDGPALGVKPFRVYCNFEREDVVVTVIHHDAKETTIPIEKCAEPGCVHKVKIHYDASDEQIKSLKEISTGCSQEITYACRSAPLLGNAWWIDNSEKINRYWSGGGQPDVHVCACGIDINCVAPSQADSNVDLMCNCDANSADLYADEGILTDTDALPVRELHFKGLTSTKQSANITLGPLKCFGKKGFSPSESCQSLRRSGHTKSGLYLIQPSESHLEVAKCNMHLENHDSRFQQTLNARIQIDTILFDAYRSSTIDARGSSSIIVPYENFTVTIGGGMSLADGVFTAPVPGIYSFSFHALDYSISRAAIVHLRKNGDVLQVGYSYPANSRGTFGFQTLVTLSKGDQVDTMLTGQLFSNSNRLVHFSGILLRPGAE